MVQADALALKHHADPPIPEPAALRRDLAHTLADTAIMAALRLIAICLRRNASEGASAALAVLSFIDRPGHGVSPRLGR